jgi:hypothetical protein
VTIWKIPLDAIRKQIVVLTKGAEILTVHLQRGEPHLWVMLDPKAERELRAVECYGTGHDVEEPSGLKYIGSTFDESGLPLVFHFFERSEQ